MRSLSRYLFIVVIFISARGNAQSIAVRTDRNQILIGERVEYILSVNGADQQQTVEVEFPDSIAHFDVLRKDGFTSAANPRQYKVLLTSFDSGSWFIPSLPVKISANGLVQTMRTDSVLINVDYSVADSTDVLRDIKPIMEVEVKDYFWYYVAAGIISILLVLLLISNYLKKRRQRPKPVFHQTLSAYEEAMESLKKLRSVDITTESGIRFFHTTLGDLFRKYYSRTIQKDVMNHTTGDLLLLLKSANGQAQLVSELATALRVTDAVKFAKYRPTEEYSDQIKEEIRKIIDEIESKKMTTDTKGS